MRTLLSERSGWLRAIPVVTMASVERPDLTGSDAGSVLARLYDEHARGLHRYLARRLDPATADDLVADTFLLAWEQRGRYEPERATVRAWLYGIATNLLRRHARSEVRGLRATARDVGRADVDEGTDSVAVSRADASVKARRLGAALAKLRQEERDVLLLVAWAGLKPVEVADALKIDAGTVRTRLHRARSALRDHLGAER
ncbi:sigma-70 family RNA polymerase sigma factor [Kibdelosporangium philippinense]|uniref:Sigma-70 family RNA polymerase sigma factor n=1 Tax=Kibdelosporangium philippinense TaxID=211113 RepID=A0ABS8ZN31_9PSEU|nr:sigma-70 family RNA polymerase sigma factor [Kibdelosporangium philippinense]MCE7009180.1 sigma-70 family RNA polymerase sigma factor [Kibdelosporangium philippinense]